MITVMDRGLLNLHTLLDGTEPCALAGDSDSYWFSDPTDDDAQTYAQLACQGCRVRVECAAYALAHPDLVGVWGGTTEAHRDTLRATFRRNAGRVAS